MRAWNLAIFIQLSWRKVRVMERFDDEYFSEAAKASNSGFQTPSTNLPLNTVDFGVANTLKRFWYAIDNNYLTVKNFWCLIKPHPRIEAIQIVANHQLLACAVATKIVIQRTRLFFRAGEELMICIINAKNKML